MQYPAHAVISCFNTDPTNLTKRFATFSIYDQSDHPEVSTEINSRFTNVIHTTNSGHSLSHYLMYILENYENLPEYIYFLKSNLINRHIDQICFENLLSKTGNGYVGLFNDSTFQDKKRIAYFLLPGLFIERNNSWYLGEKETRFFGSYDEFLSFLFVKPIHPEYVPFTPGACFGVSGSQLRSIPKNVWLALLKISTYSYFPPEAYLVERVLFTLFHSPFQFNTHFKSEESLDHELKIREKRNSRKRRMIAKRYRVFPRNGFLYKAYFKFLSKYRFEITSRY